MRYILLILTLGILTSCSSKRYLLTDTNENKTYLVNYIKNLENKGKITNNPLLVIDGLVYEDKTVKENKIPFGKDDILKINYFSKDSVGAINIYGDKATNGVILISTKKSIVRNKKKGTKSMSDSTILFLIDAKQITEEEFKAIDPNDIQSVEVIKEKDTIVKYTPKDYDGVMIITMKKDIEKNK